MILTKEQKEIFERWVIENIDDTTVPQDEGNGDALIYNIVHLIRGDNDVYNYIEYQDAELAEWGLSDE